MPQTKRLAVHPGRQHQPKNKPHGGGIPRNEGLPVDLRAQVGDQMHAMLSLLAEEANISISAYVRDALRKHLADLGIEF